MNWTTHEKSLPHGSPSLRPLVDCRVGIRGRKRVCINTAIEVWEADKDLHGQHDNIKTLVNCCA